MNLKELTDWCNSDEAMSLDLQTLIEVETDEGWKYRVSEIETVRDSEGNETVRLYATDVP